MLDSIVNWLGSSAINGMIQSTAWAWPTLESIHFVGLILMLGSLLIIDLALIGVLKGVSPEATHSLTKLVVVGFTANLITGILFIFGDPGRYFINISFQLKMVFLVLAGINAIWYIKKIAPTIEGASTFVATGATKVSGLLSLVFWFLVLIFGRMIPYLGTG